MSCLSLLAVAGLASLAPFASGNEEAHRRLMKSMGAGMGKMMSQKLAAVEAALKADVEPPAAMSGVPCGVDGMAGEYLCNNVDLLSFVPRKDLFGSTVHDAAAFSDIWGWTDTEGDGHEYVLLGALTGTTFVDVTDPLAPVVVGFAETGGDCEGFNFWRDVKTVGHYAYIVADHLPGAGLQVVDLTQLRGVAASVGAGGRKLRFGSFTPPEPLPVCNESTVASVIYTDVLDTAHNVVSFSPTDVAAGAEPVLIATGAKDADGELLCGGGLAFFGLEDPMNPNYLGCFGTVYTHDAQCVLYHGPDVEYQGRELCFCSNTNEISVVDVTDKAKPFLINRVYGCSAGEFSPPQNVYPYGIECSESLPEVDGGPYHSWKPGFVHQGWLTEDHAHFILGDEGDEEKLLVNNVTSYLFDFSDLDLLKYAGRFEAGYVGVDHNLYVNGNKSYHADYTAGLRVRSANVAADPKEVGFFDVAPDYVTGYITDFANVGNGVADAMPSDEGAGFIFLGAWSVYPFFASGTVAVSSVDRGLFLLKYTGSD
ncbi:hypothetical protein M885DRAFT_512817 [Pelagophyceae sp. CCMP2097]|nr:hypothetical protein M885DRAFT_512817 [Pelagophyceae sp. CCMP2097]